MKRIIFPLIIIILLNLTIVNAQEVCSPKVTLLNQDPYPAVPGDNIKLVFQVTGVANTQCGLVTATLVEDFPFHLEPGQSATKQIQSSTYSTYEFKSHWQVPYKLIVEKGAPDGEKEIKLIIQGEKSVTKTLEFNVTIENLLGDFEVSIKDYEPDTSILTFEILNIGEADVEALTIEIPKQQNIGVKGSSRNIVGGLDSNEDTTFYFEAIPKDGEISLTILYTDEINTRRMLEKTIIFDSQYFNERARDKTSTPIWVWIVVAVVILLALWFWNERRKKKKHRARHSAN